MKNGKCIKCGATTVYTQPNGIAWENQAGVYVKGLAWLAKPHPVDTYVCTQCGYFENYLPDKNILQKITESDKWKKV